MATALVAAASGVVAVPAVSLPACRRRRPGPTCWRSVAIHVVYYLTLARGLPRRRPRASLPDRARHRAADDRRSGQRSGCGEGLGIYGWVGVIVLAAGILLLAFRAGAR